MGKNNTPYKVSEESLAFLRKINENAYKAGLIEYCHISYDDLIRYIHQFFKINNEQYIKLLDLIGKLREEKNNGFR